MLHGLRMRVMSLLGISTHRLGDATRIRKVRSDDRARNERLGPQEGAIENARSFAEEIDAKTLRIRR